MNSIQKLVGSHIDWDIDVNKLGKPIVSSLNLVCRWICLRHTTEVRCGNPFILQGNQGATCIDRVIGKVMNSFHIEFSAKFIWKLIGINIDQEKDIKKLEKWITTLLKKGVEIHSFHMEISGKFCFLWDTSGFVARKSVIQIQFYPRLEQYFLCRISYPSHSNCTILVFFPSWEVYGTLEWVLALPCYYLTERGSCTPPSISMVKCNH